MVIIGKSQIAGGGGTAKRLEFEYTGTYNERLDDGVVELLTSGVLTVTKDTAIDAFLVGGGASGNVGNFTPSGSATLMGGGGGGGGHTQNMSVTLRAGKEYSIVIGAGGAAVSIGTGQGDGNLGNVGGATSAFGYTAEGGAVATAYVGGGSGGSGGGASSRGNASGGNAGAGGSDGSNGADGFPANANPYYGGTGQGTTTREFGDADGKLYAGGGGGGGGVYRTSSGTMYYNNGGAGGEGGGGAGGKAGGTNDTTKSKGVDGTENTGGGGGGSPAQWGNSDLRVSGSGGSGIVCIRLHKE